MGNDVDIGKVDVQNERAEKMMKVVQINATCGTGSTGKICTSVSDLLTQMQIENYILYTLGHSNHPAGIKYMSLSEAKWQAVKSRLFGNYGFQSRCATKRLLSHLEQISPEIVHLHNLHSHNVNLKELFTYFREREIKIVWTFHDCWSFTAYCPYYDIIQCDRWKFHCQTCPQHSRFSWFFDRSRYLYKQKKKLFDGLDLTIVTPSQWLADQVGQSFLKKYPIKVIHNGIDLSVFRPRKSDFRKKYNIEDKYIVLGVAFDWGVRKGLDVFVRLAQKLDKMFQIVLVGTNASIDKQLPSNIISIHRTANQIELAEIYSAADIFVNPTREEVLGLVNIEANACGIPVLTYRTGGSPECIDETSGMVVERNDEESLYNAILNIEKVRSFTAENCIKHAQKFSNEKKYREYLSLYAVE